MKIRSNRKIIFIFLSILFLIYTVIVLTKGTEQDKGKKFFTEEAAHGKLLYQKYNCTSCHQLYGLGGYMGPDLTNVIGTKGPLYSKALIQSGTNQMPNFKLSQKEVNDLVAYLTYIDQTGISPVKNFNVNLSGTISINNNEK